MVLHLKTCCCGCKLQTGSVIIGFVSMIVALLGLIVNVLLAKEMHARLKQHEKDPNAQPKSTIKEVATDPMLLVHILLAIVNVIYLILSILLVVGAIGERPHLVKPWIICSVLSLVLTISVMDHVVLTVCVATAVYFIWVVNSYHTELIANNFHSRI